MKTVWRYLAYAGWLAIAVLSLVPGQDRPHTGFSGVSEHFLAYALVAGAFCLSAQNIRQMIWFAVFLTTASAVFEICQLYIPGRRGELIGVLSAAAGAGAAVLVTHFYRRFTQPKP
jgi:VanZ family protein